MVAVGAGADEEGRVARGQVLPGERGQPALHRQLGRVVRQVFDRTVEQRGRGHIGEQGIDRGRADRGEHSFAVGIGQGEVAHQSFATNAL